MCLHVRTPDPEEGLSPSKNTPVSQLHEKARPRETSPSFFHRPPWSKRQLSSSIQF